MADDSIENIRLALMQDVLPVGIAMVERVRKGGVSQVVEALTSLEDSLQELKTEGGPAAETLREQLDKVSPGLGNPVVPIKVSVEETTNPQGEQSVDHESLMRCLQRIQVGMEELEVLLLDDSCEKATSISG